MESPDQSERREYKRVLINMDIGVSHLHGEHSNSDHSAISCQGRDVSGGGVSFYGQTQYQTESLLRLRILLSKGNASEQADNGKLLKVMGKVMWCKKNGTANSYVTGVQFLNIYEQDFCLLNEYIQNMMTT
jgi:c-di-GMP-binding flagellar brake protein YcgR